jgi:excisionase family DNA binding protein
VTHDRPSPPVLLWTAEEVAYAVAVGVEVIEAKRKAGEITAVKVGRAWRYHPEDVQAWINGLRPATAPESCTAHPRPAPAPANTTRRYGMATTPSCLQPRRRVARCPDCARKDATIWRLETELHRLVQELINTAADLAVAEGAPE